MLVGKIMSRYCIIQGIFVSLLSERESEAGMITE
jgi:hypothetical protein